jgi:hypothetical protein
MFIEIKTEQPSSAGTTQTMAQTHRSGAGGAPYFNAPLRINHFQKRHLPYFVSEKGFRITKKLA